MIKYDDYVGLGSEAAVKAAGKMGVEGKEYVVQDGDILHFLFNVRPPAGSQTGISRWPEPASQAPAIGLLWRRGNQRRVRNERSDSTTVEWWGEDGLKPQPWPPSGSTIISAGVPA